MRNRMFSTLLSLPYRLSLPLSPPGNPLRTIRRSLISGGAESLKKYLRSRAPDPSVYAVGDAAALVPVEGVVAMADGADKWRVQRRDVRAPTSRFSRCFVWACFCAVAFVCESWSVCFRPVLCRFVSLWRAVFHLFGRSLVCVFVCVLCMQAMSSGVLDISGHGLAEIPTEGLLAGACMRLIPLSLY